MSYAKSIIKVSLFSLVLGGTFKCFPLIAAELPLDGYRIAERAERNKDGFNDHSANVTMILRNAAGDTSQREMIIDTLEQEDDGDKVLITFLTPGDLKGTSLLNYTHRAKDDERWLYLPVLKRVKRIASKNKSGPFMGSEFSYEDLSSVEINKFDYRFLREENLDGQAAYVVERTPNDLYTGYKSQQVWYGKEALRILKIEYYDRKNSLLKTQRNKDFKLFEQQYWYPMTISMVNHQTQQSTELIYNQFKLNQQLDDKLFHPAQLKRNRRQ